MTRRAFASLLLAAPLAAVAGTYSLAGSLDSGYGRSDSSSAGQSASAPAWDYGGQLNLNAVPLRPDLLVANGSLSYREYHAEYGDTATRNDALGYAGTVSVLQRFPLSLSGFASRTKTDFSTSAATTQTGSSQVNTQGGTAVFHLDQAPTVLASISRTDFDNEGMGGLKTTGNSTNLSVGASHQLENQNYSTSYATSWNGGTFGDNNYRTHHFTFFGNTNLSKDFDLRVNEQYYLRVPTVVADNSPRFDDNALSAQAFWRPGGGLIGNAGYSYHHLVADFQGLAPNREALSHSFSLGNEWTRGEAWSYSAGLGAGLTDDRMGTESTKSSGESLTGGARWTRKAGPGTWMVNGNGSLGVSQSAGQSYAAYGAGAGAGWNGNAGPWTTGFSLTSGFSSNLNGQIGWSLSNLVVANAATQLLGGISFNSQLQAGDTRQHTPLFGDSSTQTLTLTTSASYRVHSVALSGGISNAGAQGLSSPVGSQFLPTATNTFSRFVTLSAGTSLARNLVLSGFARYSATSAPSRPDTWESAFNLRLGYHLGLFDVSAEDRYTVGASGGSSAKVNVILFRISRSFGLAI